MAASAVNPDTVSALRLQLRAFRDLRPGDVLWVGVNPEDASDDSFLEVLRDTVMDAVNHEVGVLVTPTNLVATMEVLKLEQLLQLQALVESLVARHLHPTEAAES